MTMKMLAISTMVATAFAFMGCASSGDDGGDESKSTDKTSEKLSSEMIEMEGSHDGMCSGGEIILGCAQQACTHGTGLPNPQCPMGYYCWCW